MRSLPLRLLFIDGTHRDMTLGELLDRGVPIDPGTEMPADIANYVPDPRIPHIPPTFHTLGADQRCPCCGSDDLRAVDWIPRAYPLDLEDGALTGSYGNQRMCYVGCSETYIECCNCGASITAPPTLFTEDR